MPADRTTVLWVDITKYRNYFRTDTNWFVFITESPCVYDAVGAEFEIQSSNGWNEWKRSAVRHPLDVASPGISTVMWTLQSRQWLPDLLLGCFRNLSVTRVSVSTNLFLTVLWDKRINEGYNNSLLVWDFRFFWQWLWNSGVARFSLPWALLTEMINFKK